MESTRRAQSPSLAQGLQNSGLEGDVLQHYQRSQHHTNQPHAGLGRQRNRPDVAQPRGDVDRFDVAFNLDREDDRTFQRELRERISWNGSGTSPGLLAILVGIPVGAALLTYGTGNVPFLLRQSAMFTASWLAAVGAIVKVLMFLTPLFNERYSRHRVTIDQFGLIDRTETRSVSAAWDDVRQVQVTDRHIAITYQQSPWLVFDALLLIPSNAFSSYHQRQAFIATCKRKWLQAS